MPEDFNLKRKGSHYVRTGPARTKKRSDGASFWMIPATCGETEVKKMHMSGKLGVSVTEPQVCCCDCLMCACACDVLKILSLSLQVVNGCGLVPYRTDYYASIPFFFTVPHTCFQAALVLATGIDLRGLGIEWVDPTSASVERRNFQELNTMLRESSGFGQLFVLCKLRPELSSDREVFRLEAGIYVIHTYWYEVCYKIYASLILNSLGVCQVHPMLADCRCGTTGE